MFHTIILYDYDLNIQHYTFMFIILYYLFNTILHHNISTNGWTWRTYISNVINIINFILKPLQFLNVFIRFAFSQLYKR